MKLKIFLTGLFLIVGFNSFSQARIGFTESQIRSEFYYLSFEEGVTNDGFKYIYTYGDRGAIAYFFDEDGICILTRYMPYTQGDLNYYVEIYNSRYVILSETHWKAYLKNGGIIDIYLITTDDGLTYFEMM